MWIILVIFAVIAAVIGFLTFTQSSLGIGFILVGCFFGILARIAQAFTHHKEMMTILGSLENKSQNLASSASIQSQKPAKSDDLDNELFSEPREKE